MRRREEEGGEGGRERRGEGREGGRGGEQGGWKGYSWGTRRGLAEDYEGTRSY